MKTVKMSLANIQGKLSRNEMKQIMAGSGGLSCAPSGQLCPNPNGQYDGCCNSCVKANSGIYYCS